MDKETCWKWFCEVFVPEVRRRTGRFLNLMFVQYSKTVEDLHFQLYHPSFIK